MKAKKTPMRMCLGCSQMKPKKELIRAVKAADGSISLDFTGKKNGRGAYICKSLDCLNAARKAKKFEKSFSCRIDDSVYEEMENELSAENDKPSDNMP